MCVVECGWDLKLALVCRRSVDNRDNGAPRESAWHGVASVEAAVQTLNDM